MHPLAKLSFEYDPRSMQRALLAAALLLMLYLGFGQLIPLGHQAHQVRAAKTGLLQVQVAIERYALAHGGRYPYELAELANLGYLDRFPENPYTGRAMRYFERDLLPGEELRAPAPPPGARRGDFIYLREYDSEREYAARSPGGYLLVLCEADAPLLRPAVD
jgi:hypothetical protein